jgi:protease IV
VKKRTAIVLISAVVAVSLGVAAVGAVALLLRGTRPTGTPFASSSNSYLALNLSGEVPEEPPSSELPAFLERRPPSLRTLVEGLDRARQDPRIKSVVLRVSFLSDAGFGKVQELRDAIVRFRKSGKPAYAHLEFAGNKEFYLASACDKIYAVPTALLDVTGLAAEVTFYKGTFDKVGVEAQFVGVGKYKNAPNQYTETGFTEPHREQTEALIDSLYAQYVAALAMSRDKTQDEIRALIDRGPYDGKQALEAGLVDELIYADQLDDRLKGAEKINPGRYVKGSRGMGFDGRPKIALIYAVGTIIPGEGGQGPLGSLFVGSDTVARALREARRDSSIQAIVLRVDSPGGSGTASDVIWREVELAKKAKPVVVSMGDVAASGGYYIAMGSDEIIAQPGTITGSIGVFGGKFSLRRLYEKIGISQETVLRGRNAALFSEYRPWNAEERAKVESLMTDFYDDFVTKAAEGRKKTWDEVHAVAQGRVWTGVEALEQGLVDKLGGLDVALASAKVRAKIPAGREVAIVVLPEHKGWFETFMERQEEDPEGATDQVRLLARVLPTNLRTFLEAAATLSDGGPIARLPFELSVR